eukprot:820233-Rhodomonas_salina.2
MWSESGATFANVQVRTCHAWTGCGWSAWCGVVVVVGWSCAGLGCIALPEAHEWLACNASQHGHFLLPLALGWAGFGSLSLAVHKLAAPEMAAHTPAARIMLGCEGLRPSFSKKLEQLSARTALRTLKISWTVVTVWMEAENCLLSCSVLATFQSKGIFDGVRMVELVNSRKYTVPCKRLYTTLSGRLFCSCSCSAGKAHSCLKGRLLKVVSS